MVLPVALSVLLCAAYKQAPAQVCALLQPRRGFASHTMFLSCWKVGDPSSQVAVYSRERRDLSQLTLSSPCSMTEVFKSLFCSENSKCLDHLEVPAYTQPCS